MEKQLTRSGKLCSDAEFPLIAKHLRSAWDILSKDVNKPGRGYDYSKICRYAYSTDSYVSTLLDVSYVRFLICIFLWNPLDQ